MLFSQIEFVLLFAVVLTLHWVLRSNRARKLLLLVFSIYFYGYWDVRFLGLLAFSTILDYIVGIRLELTDEERKRKVLLIISMTCNLGLLGFFKYYNFFVESARVALGRFGFEPTSLEIVLPVGISFYTFQTMSYTIDVYRRNLRATRDILDFALFVTFFPQLVAGPIVRASEFIHQLDHITRLTRTDAYRGVRQFIFGLFKKVLIADNVAFVVDQVFAHPASYDSPTVWLGVLCYAVQIYCDFSGYSDMAIGIARLLGYQLPENFRHPYVSTSIDEFWRRWHISLSTWLRDYLYIPLGGNRLGPGRTYVNLMTTMLLGGLWHGASWNFVFWGALHGGALAITKLLRDAGIPSVGFRNTWFGTAMGWIITMLTVLIGWVVFRAPDAATAWAVYMGMFLPRGGITWLYPMAVVMVALVAWSHWYFEKRRAAGVEMPADSVATAFILGCMLWAVLLYSRTDFTPFIYFQF